MYLQFLIIISDYKLPVKFEVSVMQVGKSLRITIPKEIGKHLNLVKGDMVELWVDNHNVVMEKKK